ncbi:MAG TPA: tyrosine-type recombinase/integrase [Aestuariivirgaceae bacterium]
MSTHTKTRRVRHDPAAGLPNTLRSPLEEYLIAMAARGQALLTVELKRVHLARFLYWARDDGGIASTGQITALLLERFRQTVYRTRKRDGRPLALSTQHQRLVPLRSFCRWLAKYGYLNADPSADFELPRVPMPLPAHVPTPQQVEHVIGSCDTGTRCGLRDRAALELFYSSGLRRQELASLNLLDLDLETGVVFIRFGKGGRSRYVPVGRRAAYWVRRYLSEVRPLLTTSQAAETVFLNDSGEPYVRHRLSDLVRRRLNRAGLTQRGACHLLRHAMATHMLHNGADVRHLQAILGHADLGTTARYTQVSIRDLQQVHARTHPSELRSK